MRTAEKTETLLVIDDSQADKKFAVTALSLAATIGSLWFWYREGFAWLWPVFILLAAGGYAWMRFCLIKTTIRFDKGTDRIDMKVERRTGTET